MTELDKWEPRGEPIHPYDVYELLRDGDFSEFDVLEKSPKADGEGDYTRNVTKHGSVFAIGDKLYFMTTSTEPKICACKPSPILNQLCGVHNPELASQAK